MTPDGTLDNAWDKRYAGEVAHSIVDHLRRNAAYPLEGAKFRGLRLSRQGLRRALAFVNANLDSKLNWGRIARAVGMSTFSFGRRFKVTTGITPHQYVIRRRIRKAMSLLASTERSICDIALDVGCACQSHLTTMFRKYAGTTPSAFRRSAKANRRVPPAAHAAAAWEQPSRL